MKRTRCDSTCDQLAKKARHKIEYDKRWKEFPWHVPVYNEEGNSESCMVGLLCSICQRHDTKQRNRAGTCTDQPCTYLRKDMLHRHKASKMHQDVEACEANRLASQSDGSIVQAFCYSCNEQESTSWGSTNNVLAGQGRNSSYH